MMLHLLFALSLLAVVFGLHYDNAFHNIPTIIGETVSERQTTGFSVADGMHMNYEYEQNEQVSISVDSKHKVVDLAKVREINEVMCWQNDTGLAISFESRDAYEMSIKSWSQHSTLVLMAGGLGNCDVDNKHQYHVSSNMHWHEDELVVAVDTEKKDLVDIATSIRVEFSGFRFKRRPTTEVPPQHWDSIVTTTADQPLSDYPQVIGKTEQGFFNTNFSYSGVLWYFPGDSYPKELQLEINLASADGVPQDLNVTGPYNGTVGFQEEPVDSYIYGIPGVMSILPTLLYSGGAEIISESPTVARTNFTSSLVNGSVHLDLVTPGNGYITGLWDGDYGSGVAIDPIASIRISPFITLAAVFSVDVTGMNRTLYQGFQAKAKSSYDFLPNGTDKVCTRTAYGYTIDTFNYNGFKRTLYDRQDPFISRCD